MFRTLGGIGPFNNNTFKRPGPTGFSYYSTAEEVAKDWSGADRTVLITGASSGLGLESARVLALHGADVVLAVRNATKMQGAIDELKARHPTSEMRFTAMDLDLSSLASVKAFADAYKATGKPIHVLMLNAGVMACPFQRSKDGFELQFATNHLGHFLLIDLLLPTVLDSAAKSGVASRIVVVSSRGQYLTKAKTVEQFAAKITADAVRSDVKYDEWDAYGRSKLANVLFARQLAERLEGAPVVTVSLHPGDIVATDLSRHLLTNLPNFLRSFLIDVVLGKWMSGSFKTLAQGAATQVYCAVGPLGTDKGVVAGEYYYNVNIAPSSELSHSKALAQQLWDVSEQLVAPFKQ